MKVTQVKKRTLKKFAFFALFIIFVHSLIILNNSYMLYLLEVQNKDQYYYKDI